MLPGDPGLPPGVSEYTIPGNRPEDVWAEQLEQALQEHLRLAIQQGDLPSWVEVDDIWRDVEIVAFEWMDADPDEIAAEAVDRYIERRRMEDGEDEAA